MVMYFVWWIHMVTRVPPLWSWVLSTLECGYASKANVIGAYSYYICTWLSWCDCLRSMSASDINFLVYATWANVFNALVSSDLPQYKHTNACHIHRHETCQYTIAHQTQNFARFLPSKWGILLLYSHRENLVRIVFYLLWHNWPKMLLDFYHENKVECYQIFFVMSALQAQFF